MCTVPSPQVGGAIIMAGDKINRAVVGGNGAGGVLMKNEELGINNPENAHNEA